MQDNAGIVKEKVAECMNKIFAFSLSRTNSTSEAEDLSQQIIVELLSSAGNLKDINAFYGWLWAVAKNVYGKYLRSLSKEKDTRYGGDFYELALPDKKASVEDELILAGDINLLKRELAILSRKYREAVVKYYLEDKSCAQISEELTVTVETVKHLLFKARKILKEGMNMNREFGEKSYKPGEFCINMFTSGMANDVYWNIFKDRKLPGNILLSAYYEPLTIEEMSIELGVAAAYLEDEVKILLDAGLIKLLQNGRYQTKIFIYTKACEEDIALKTRKLYNNIAPKLSAFIDKNADKIKELAFNGEDVSQNRLRWFAANFIVWNGLAQSDKEWPSLTLGGGTGYVWGINKNTDDSRKNGKFYGISGGTSNSHYNGSIRTVNYTLLKECQIFGGVQGIGRDNEMILGAAHNSFDRFTPDEIAEYVKLGWLEKSGDSYKALFPILTNEQEDKLIEFSTEIRNEISNILSEIIGVIAKVMGNHAPSAIKDICGGLASISNSFDGLYYTVEDLCESGWLIVPQTQQLLTTFVVL